MGRRSGAMTELKIENGELRIQPHGEYSKLLLIFTTEVYFRRLCIILYQIFLM